MADYIKREDAIRVNASQVEFCKSEGLDFSGKLHIDSIINNLKHIPAADVVERKTGKWERKLVPVFDGGVIVVPGNVCSACGGVTTYSTSLFKYCPRCGARMVTDDA